MLSNFFDVLGYVVAWGMWLMLCVAAFVLTKTITLGLWKLAKALHLGL